jgi:hypothetical protein
VPTNYSNATEMMVLEEFRKKINQEEGVASFEKSETPDGIIHTQKGQTIGVEVTQKKSQRQKQSSHLHQ